MGRKRTPAVKLITQSLTALTWSESVCVISGGYAGTGKDVNSDKYTVQIFLPGKLLRPLPPGIPLVLVTTL